MNFTQKGGEQTVKIDGVNYKFYYFTTSFGLKIAMKLGSTLVGPLMTVIMKRDTKKEEGTNLKDLKDSAGDIDIDSIVNNFLDKLDPEQKIDLMKDIIERFVKTETTKSIDFDDYFRGNYIHAFRVLHKSLEVNFDFLELITRQGKKFIKRAGQTPSPVTDLTPASSG